MAMEKDMGWKSLGKVTVTTAGTPVRLTNNETTPAANYPCQSILVETWHDNSGKIWIYDRATGSKTTGVGVLAYLAAPTASTAPSAGVTSHSSPNGLNANEYWLDADSDGEAAAVSIYRL